MKCRCYRFALVCGVLLALSSCDVIEHPVIPITTNYQEGIYGPVPEFDALPVSDASQRVLIEDFTAHQCGNCPEAAVIAVQIAEANSIGVSIMAIHAGNLALTDEDHFDTDWTTEEGDFFWNQLDFQANPIGRINRSGGPGNFWTPAQWSGQTNALLAESPLLGLQVIHEWAPENNHLNMHVHGTFYGNVSGPIHISLLILESDIVDYQLDYSSDPELVSDYIFNHTLRGSVHGAMGLGFGDAQDGAVNGTTATHSVTYTWDSEVVTENATVLIVVTDGSGLVLNSHELHPV